MVPIRTRPAGGVSARSGASVPNGYTSLALPHQIRSISKTRLLEWIGALDGADARHDVECGILYHLAIEFDEIE